jgi:hypothetical protein
MRVLYDSKVNGLQHDVGKTSADNEDADKLIARQIAVYIPESGGGTVAEIRAKFKPSHRALAWALVESGRA